MTLMETVVRSRILAVLTVDNADRAVPLARALLEGGISAMELTLRTPQALDSLGRIVREVPEMIAGAGTVITPDQARAVADLGAAFAVAPGANRRVLQAAQDAGLWFAPGIATASDIETALEFDCRLLKFFPAETSGGLKHLRNMAAPYKHLGIRFVPLGGINEGNAAAYLADPLIAAVGGSWIAPPDDIREERWDAITARARSAMLIAAAT